MSPSRIEQDPSITWETLSQCQDFPALTDREIRILNVRAGIWYERWKVPTPKNPSLWVRIKALVREWFTNPVSGEDDSEAMWEADPQLFLTVMAAASALAEEYDICHKDICVDISHLGAEMLKDAGYDTFMMCYNWRGLEERVIKPFGHCWIRVENDWHVDFGAVQFPELTELPYPLITHREGCLTAGIYGEGASRKRLHGEYYRFSRKSIKPPLVDVSRVLRSQTREELEALWERNWTGDPVRSFLAFQKFREILDSLELTDKGVPVLAHESADR